MATKLALFTLGLGIDVLSFFLFATGDPKGPVGRMRGYECAYLSAQTAVTTTPFSPKSDDYEPPLMYIPALISALINPVFLFDVALSFLKPMPRTAKILKFALLSMIPFCWLVFYNLLVYPREGHVFWVIGMLLVLLSDWKRAPASGNAAFQDEPLGGAPA